MKNTDGERTITVTIEEGDATIGDAGGSRVTRVSRRLPTSKTRSGPVHLAMSMSILLYLAHLAKKEDRTHRKSIKGQHDRIRTLLEKTLTELGRLPDGNGIMRCGGRCAPLEASLRSDLLTRDWAPSEDLKGRPWGHQTALEEDIRRLEVAREDRVTIKRQLFGRTCQ